MESKKAVGSGKAGKYTDVDTGKYDHSQTQERKARRRQDESKPLVVTQQPQHYESKSVGVRSRSFSCSIPVPSADGLHRFAKVAGLGGTFFSTMAAFLFASPGLIMLDCNPPNGTLSKYNGTYDCYADSVFQDGLIAGGVELAQFMLICAITLGYKCSSRSSSEGYKSLSGNSCIPNCSAPSSTKLQFAAAHFGVFSLAMAVSLFASLGIIEASCNYQNITESGSNHTKIYGCTIPSVAEQNAKYGAGLLGLGLFLYFIALVVDRWNGDTTRNSEVIRDDDNRLSIIDEKGMSQESIVKFWKDKHPVEYMEKEIEAYTPIYRDVYDAEYQRVIKTSGDVVAGSYALGAAQQAAETYAQDEALKYVKTIGNSITSYESEHIALGSSVGTESAGDNAEKLKKDFPNKYRRYYIRAFIEKFGKEYKPGQAKNAQEVAIQYAKAQAIELIEAYLERNEDRSLMDDES